MNEICTALIEKLNLSDPSVKWTQFCFMYLRSFSNIIIIILDGIDFFVDFSENHNFIWENR